ncbi:hypothetical protein Tco_0682719, partial [Tanacetum coccineum]
MEEINNFQQEPDENLFQAWDRFKELLMKCPQHYLTEMQEVVLFYNGLDVPTRQILDSKGAIPSKTVADTKVPTIPKIAHSRKKGIPIKKLTTLNLVHLFKEGDIEQLLQDSTKGIMQTLQIRASTDPAIRNQGALNENFRDPNQANKQEARLMGRDFGVKLNQLDAFLRITLELNDINCPLELRRDKIDDLMPTIEEGEVVEEFRARNNARMVSKFFGYPSECDHDKKIHIDCAHNLKFSCMIDFAVLEDTDAYRDEGMGDVIFGKPFLREVGINAKWFEGMITIHNGNEEVTYQMVRSHPRFKHHTYKQCNKIPPSLK